MTPNRTKSTRLVLLATLLSGCASPPSAVPSRTPQETVTGWLGAVRDLDGQRAASFLVKRLRDDPMCTGTEALEFWKREIFDGNESLAERGFQGNWREAAGTLDGVAVRYLEPQLTGAPAGEAVWLIAEDGEWRIHTLFVHPPG